MRHPPLLSIAKTEGLGTGEKENAPAVKGSMGFGHGKILAEQAENFLLVAIEVVEPAFRGLGIVGTRPAPPCFQFQVAGYPEEELVGGHGASAEEMFGHPVVLSFDLEGIGGRTVAEDVSE